MTFLYTIFMHIVTYIRQSISIQFHGLNHSQVHLRAALYFCLHLHYGSISATTNLFSKNSTILIYSDFCNTRSINLNNQYFVNTWISKIRISFLCKLLSNMVCYLNCACDIFCTHKQQILRAHIILIKCNSIIVSVDGCLSIY